MSCTQPICAKPVTTFQGRTIVLGPIAALNDLNIPSYNGVGYDASFITPADSGGSPIVPSSTTLAEGFKQHATGEVSPRKAGTYIVGLTGTVATSTTAPGDDAIATILKNGAPEATLTVEVGASGEVTLATETDATLELLTTDKVGVSVAITGATFGFIDLSLTIERVI